MKYVTNAARLEEGISMMDVEDAERLVHYLARADHFSKRAWQAVYSPDYDTVEKGVQFFVDNEQKYERRAFGILLYADSLQKKVSGKFAIDLGGERIRYKGDEYEALSEQDRMKVMAVVRSVTAEATTAMLRYAV